MEASNYQAQARLARLVSRVQTEMEAALDRALAPYDVTAAQYVILSALWSGRADTAARICKEISYSPGAMTRMLDRLEQKQLICRTRMADSRRAVKLELSSAGKQIFPELYAASAKVIDRYVGALSDTELNQLEVLLSKMLTAA